MASKTRSLARGIAHARMAEEGINLSFSANWRKYVFPPAKSRKKIRKKKNKKA